MAPRWERIWLSGALAASAAALPASALPACGGAREPALRRPALEIDESAQASSAPQRDQAPALVHARPAQAPAPTEAPAEQAHDSDLDATAVPEDGALQAEHDAQLASDALAARYPLHGVAFHLLSQVFERPDTRSFVIGLMRRGTTLRASSAIKPDDKAHGCDSSWHELWTGGFICRGRGFQLGRGAQTFEPSPAPAALHDPLPYPYAKVVGAQVLQYFRLPTTQEQAQAVAAYAAARTQAAVTPTRQTSLEMTAGVTADVTALTAVAASDARPAPIHPLVHMPMAPGFYVSVDGVVNDNGRAFVRTVRGRFVEQSALVEVAAPHAAGGPIATGEPLPFGIVYRPGALLETRDPQALNVQASEPLDRFARIALDDASTQVHGRLRTRAGQWVAASKLRRVEPVVRPALVPKHARLIHVRLAEQTLVAYEGERPVYATLVSSGKAGFETPTGLYRVHAKHVSTTMDGLAGEEDEYSIEDVAWTMYFHGSYALHAAFWHDRFGNTRSHGCVNLAPADARWLFEWATPTLPHGLHAAMATRDNPGTYVLVE